jgi:hypothetical protein
LERVIREATRGLVAGVAEAGVTLFLAGVAVIVVPLLIGCLNGGQHA